MSGEEFANLIGAKRTGPGRWQARCPVHGADKHPSLSITQGNRAVLLKCWSRGCTTESICGALGLRMADLFDGPPPTAEQARQSAQGRTRRDAEGRLRRIAHGAVCDSLLRLERVVDELGARLARLPDDADAGAALTQLFHTTLDKVRVAEGLELELRR